MNKPKKSKLDYLNISSDSGSFSKNNEKNKENRTKTEKKEETNSEKSYEKRGNPKNESKYFENSFSNSIRENYRNKRNRYNSKSEESSEKSYCLKRSRSSSSNSINCNKKKQRRKGSISSGSDYTVKKYNNENKNKNMNNKINNNLVITEENSNKINSSNKIFNKNIIKNKEVNPKTESGSSSSLEVKEYDYSIKNRYTLKKEDNKDDKNESKKGNWTEENKENSEYKTVKLEKYKVKRIDKENKEKKIMISKDKFEEIKRLKLDKFVPPKDLTLPTSPWLLYFFLSSSSSPSEIHFIDKKYFYVLGKSRKFSDIFIDEISISRQHCAVFYREKEGKITPFLVDLRSTNGTFLNKKKMQTEVVYEIKNGDWIRLGKKVEIMVVNREEM